VSGYLSNFDKTFFVPDAYLVQNSCQQGILVDEIVFSFKGAHARL